MKRLLKPDEHTADESHTNSRRRQSSTTAVRQSVEDDRSASSIVGVLFLWEFNPEIYSLPDSLIRGSAQSLSISGAS